MNLLLRPIKVRLSYWSGAFVGGVTGFACAPLCLLEFEWWSILLAVVFVAGGIWMLRGGLTAIRAVKGEEVEAKLVGPGVALVGDVRVRFRGEPLFLDDKETMVLALRAPNAILIVRGDFFPLLYSDEEAREIRGRIFERNQMRKLVSDIHTC